MKNTLQYNYRVNRNSEENKFGKGEIEPLPHSPFSLPPKPESEAEEFVIIQRPKIPELEGFVERYLDEPTIKEEKKEKNINKLVKRFIKK